MNLLLAFALIVLHLADGVEVLINPAQVTTLRPAGALLAPGVRCVVSLADGKFISVLEDCSVVADLIDKTRER